MFKIAKYISSHTCSIGILNHDHRQTTARVIGKLFKDMFVGVGHVYKPKHIVKKM